MGVLIDVLGTSLIPLEELMLVCVSSFNFITLLLSIFSSAKCRLKRAIVNYGGLAIAETLPRYLCVLVGLNFPSTDGG